MLEIENLSVSYGGLAALRGVSLSVGEGQFVAIVGPNGAGKTTLFKAISGTVAPAGGKISFEGRDLLAVPPPQRAHLGIAHVPEGRQVFASLTVLENLEMGAYAERGRAGLAAQPRPHLHAVPGPGRAARPDGRHAVRRRAADAGDRPRHGLGAAPVAARRAVDGAGADDRRHDLRPDRRAAPGGRADDPARSSSASPKRSNPAITAMFSKPAASSSKARTATLMADDRVRRAYLGM